MTEWPVVVRHAAASWMAVMTELLATPNTKGMAVASGVSSHQRITTARPSEGRALRSGFGVSSRTLAAATRMPMAVTPSEMTCGVSPATTAMAAPNMPAPATISMSRLRTRATDA